MYLSRFCSVKRSTLSDTNSRNMVDIEKVLHRYSGLLIQQKDKHENQENENKLDNTMKKSISIFSSLQRWSSSILFWSGLVGWTVMCSTFSVKKHRKKRGHQSNSLEEDHETCSSARLYISCRSLEDHLPHFLCVLLHIYPKHSKNQAKDDGSHVPLQLTSWSDSFSHPLLCIWLFHQNL